MTASVVGRRRFVWGCAVSSALPKSMSIHEDDQQWLDGYATGHDHSAIFEDDDDYSEVDDSTSGMDNPPTFIHAFNQVYVDNESVVNSITTDNGPSTALSNGSDPEGSAASYTAAGSYSTATPYGFAISHGPPGHHDSGYSSNSSFGTTTSLDYFDMAAMRTFAPLEQSSAPFMPLTPDIWNSSASHVLRENNPYSAGNNIQGPLLGGNDNNNVVEDAWDNSVADVFHETPGFAEHIHVNSTAQDSVGMNGGNNAGNSRRVAKQRSTIRGVRVSCESCRTLKVKCLSARDGGPSPSVLRAEHLVSAFSDLTLVRSLSSTHSHKLSHPSSPRLEILQKSLNDCLIVSVCASLTVDSSAPSHVTNHNHRPPGSSNMSHNQPPNERAAFAPDGYAPVFFGEHENEKNMFVDVARAAGTIPTVLRGERMSAEQEVFIEANHILTGDPVWAAGFLLLVLLVTLGRLVVTTLLLLRQPSNGMAAYGHYPGVAPSAYGDYPGAGQVGYGQINPSVAYPMPHSTTNFAFQGAGNNLWNTYPVPGPGAMPNANPAANPQLQRRSHSPVKHQTLAYRRRSPQDLNPTAPSFAPPFFAGAPAHQSFVPAPLAHLSYPPLSTQPSFPPAINHDFGPYHGATTRNGAWGFSGGVNAATPYQTRRQEAQMLVGQQRRFSPVSDDVRNHISSESSGASNDEDEQGSDEAQAESDEVTQDEAEDEESGSDEASEEETSTATTPYKKRGKFHAGNVRLVCDECHRKHKNCIKPDPNGSCIGCLKARGGPIECKVTKR
ncbi:hypothetical protein KCU65_g332, partial [Aureobasidium melanogenum]